MVQTGFVVHGLSGQIIMIMSKRREEAVVLR